jgi:hypothetical protein
VNKEVIAQINSLKGVRSAVIRAASNNVDGPYLRIETNPVVIESEYGEKIYCPSAIFDVTLDMSDRVNGENYSPDVYKMITCSKAIPHPAISPTTGPMFGKATWPLRDALKIQDYLAIAFIICGWYATFPPYRLNTSEYTKAVRHVTGWVN